jgi:glutamine synthetase
MRVLFASECSDGGGGGGPSLRIRFSTSATRSPDTGMSEIERQILQLQAAHSQHALIYGKPSERSAPFTFGLGARPSSVSIPSSTLLRRAGYYIDQRPTGNADPYLVAMLLISSALQV